ncbi:uncharacterized protein LOC119405979 [Rhipicephalus sanguineus]|uniref:PH domain-containing protein n=1 Tax=Rhipicephalus sanguineus TaxID=34632 RepID=A0A9D4TAM2_RHISA|nr:uncharacterized protein LOC119405979 [Rhipicephalus sanguineus]KAH7983941.1 hypothetical protein HPB52_015598 [Rhipicephalus sanguineus]
MVIKSGYVDVKLPQSARNSSTWKSWKRKWVDLTQLESASGQPCDVLVEVRPHRNSGVQARGTLSPKNAQVFRCGSSTREFAVAVRSGQRPPMVYLAGESETQSQEWMAALRALLWPPVPMVELENVLGFKFEASLIDDSWSGRAGLLGSYGNLSISGHKLILTHPHTEHVIQEWYLNTLVRFQVSRNKHEADHGKLLAIECGSESSTGRGVLHFYCPEALNFVYTLRGVVQGILKRLTPEQYSWKEVHEMHGRTPARRQGSAQQHRQAAIEDCNGYSVPKTNAISVLQMPTFKGPLPPPRPDEVQGFPCSRQSHLSISTFDSGISVTSAHVDSELESPVSEVAFSVSSDMDERIYEKLDDVLLRRPSLEKENDVPPPLPPKTHRRRKSEPAKTAPVEEGQSMVEPSPNERHLRPYSMPADMTTCPNESGTHVSPYGSITKATIVNSQIVDDTAAAPAEEHAPQVAPSSPPLRNTENEDVGSISRENVVSPADDDVTASETPGTREETARRRSHLHIALECNSNCQVRLSAEIVGEQSLNKDRIRSHSLVACHDQMLRQMRRQRAGSLPSLFIR